MWVWCSPPLLGREKMASQKKKKVEEVVLGPPQRRRRLLAGPLRHSRPRFRFFPPFWGGDPLRSSGPLLFPLPHSVGEGRRPHGRRSVPHPHFGAFPHAMHSPFVVGRGKRDEDGADDWRGGEAARSVRAAGWAWEESNGVGKRLTARP